MAVSLGPSGLTLGSTIKSDWSQVGSSTTLAAVGTYAFLLPGLSGESAQRPGATFSGNSQRRYSGSNGGANPWNDNVGSGSWRLMGNAYNGYATLCVRYA